MRRKYFILIGIFLTIIGTTCLFTNLFGLGAGWGMDVFFATTFPGMIFICGAFGNEKQKDRENE